MKSNKYMMNIYEDNNRVVKKLEKYLNSTIPKMYKDEVCKIEVTQGATIMSFNIKVYFLLGSGNSRRDEILNKTWDFVYNATGKSSGVFTKIVDDCNESIGLYESIRRILREEMKLQERELTERCWKGYTQKGMKTMFGKKYPNCVKIKK